LGDREHRAFNGLTNRRDVMGQRQPATTFEDLEVWQKAHQLVLETYQQTSAYPDTERFGLVSQMRRSAVSVPANIAEAFGRTSLGDKGRFLGISQGSLQELRYFYILSKDLNYLDTLEAMDRFEQIGRMLSSYSATIQRKRTKPSQ